MSANYHSDIYEPQLLEACDYQDFVCVELGKRGIILQNMTGKKMQLNCENLLGLEIKLDRKLEETGNVYMECFEKSNPQNQEYVSSGLLRKDDCWLYGIGNYSEFHLFSKRTLRFLYGYIVSSHAGFEGMRLIENGTQTSKGFLMSKDRRNYYCERVFLFDPAQTQLNF